MRKHILKKLFQAPVAIAYNLYQFKYLIRQMISTDIKGKFAGSFGGLLWQVIHHHTKT